MKNILVVTIASVFYCVAPHLSLAQTIEAQNLPLQLIDDVEVASLDAGVVTSVRAIPGTYVGVGDVLLELDSDLHEGKADVRNMAWRAAEAEANNDVNIRYSQKTLLLNGKILQKSLNAVGTYAKSISETEIDKLRLERDQSELSIEQAQVEQEVAIVTARLRNAEKTLAEIELDRRTIRSPLDGVVVDVQIQPGEAVGIAKPVVRIISTKRLRVIANVNRKFAFKLHNGADAEFVVQAEDGRQAFPAKVVFVSPEIRFTEQTFDVWVEVQNSENKLLPGMKGNLTILVK
ncbi:MAG: efflux RND transporter periplasmic adaptor subunit [Pirellulaceae bacterium]